MKVYVFIAMGILFAIWLFLSHKLLKILETRFPEKYEEMGRPHFFMSSSGKAKSGFSRFIFRREWNQYKDKELTFYGRGLLLYFVVFMILFCLYLYPGTWEYPDNVLGGIG